MSSVPTPDCSGWRVSESHLAVIYVGVSPCRERVDGGVESMYVRPILELHPNEVAKRKRHSMLGSSLSDRECESCGSVIARQQTPDELAPFYDLCACET